MSISCKLVISVVILNISKKVIEYFRQFLIVAVQYFTLLECKKTCPNLSILFVRQPDLEHQILVQICFYRTVEPSFFFSLQCNNISIASLP